MRPLRIELDKTLICYLASRQCTQRVPIVVGLTEDVVVTGGAAVVILGGSASAGWYMQFAALTVKLMSSTAISPVKLFPRIPSNTTYLKQKNSKF